jgi:hypothetical protein
MMGSTWPIFVKMVIKDTWLGLHYRSMYILILLYCKDVSDNLCRRDSSIVIQ